MADIAFDEALSKAVAAATLPQHTKRVPLDAALSYVLAEDIIVQKNLPSFDNSAMDGYAYRYEEKENPLKIVHTIFAGDTPQPQLQKNECYKIMTGAQVPSDADTIAPFEKCEVNEDEVSVPHNLPLGANLRKKGEEVCVGEILLHQGVELQSSHIALLAAQGIMEVKVYEKLSIAVVSSGDELKEPWEEANEDEIYNANGFGVVALLREHGFAANYKGKIPDDFAKTKAFLETLLEYDVIISTGGVSKGEADFLTKGYAALGVEELFHGVRLKPGHPVMMGKTPKNFIIALPGNPLTTLVVAFLLALPVLRKLQGMQQIYHTPTVAKLASSMQFRGKRTTAILGTIQEGSFSPTRGGKVGSGMLTPLCESNAIAFFDETISSVEEGAMIKVVSWPNTLWSKRFDTIYKKDDNLS